MPIRIAGRRKITVTLNSATPAQISSTNIFTPDVEIYFPVGNVGATAYIGDANVDNTWIPRDKGEPYNLVSGTGSMGGTIPELGFNLATIYLLGSHNGDTAIVEYMYYDRS